jgi:hypothetical protein
MIASIFFIASFPQASGWSGKPSSHRWFAVLVPTGRRRTSHEMQAFCWF